MEDLKPFIDNVTMEVDGVTVENSWDSLGSPAISEMLPLLYLPYSFFSLSDTSM